MKKQSKIGMKNPLYVVKNRGRDVEAAKNGLDALLKQTGIDYLLASLKELLQRIYQQLKRLQGIKELDQYLVEVAQDLATLYENLLIFLRFLFKKAGLPL